MFGFWMQPISAAGWTCAVLCVHAAIVRACYRFLADQPSLAATRKWRSRFVLLDLLYGLSWMAMLVHPALDAVSDTLMLFATGAAKNASRIDDAADPRAHQRFPHLYGPLALDAVIRVVAFPCEPDGRFATAADFEEALEDYLEQTSSRPTPGAGASSTTFW